jgi:hypothetical protein
MPEELVEKWMKGFDIRGIDPEGISSGTVIAIRDEEGNNLGAAKYSNKRLRTCSPTVTSAIKKNHYPRSGKPNLFIRLFQMVVIPSQKLGIYRTLHSQTVNDIA